MIAVAAVAAALLPIVEALRVSEAAAAFAAANKLLPPGEPYLGGAFLASLLFGLATLALAWAVGRWAPPVAVRLSAALLRRPWRRPAPP
jgi:hypothetical protein